MPGKVVMGGAVDAEGALKFLGHLFRPGYSQGLAVTQRGAGANMSVDVSAGGGMSVTAAVVAYYGWITSTENVTGFTADPSNPRRAIVVAYVDLTLISPLVTNNDGAFKFKAVLGTAAGSPTDPSDPTIQSSVGAGNPFFKLARVQIAAGATSIVNANITDLRTPMGLQLPFLYGGSNNDKGHAVPNTSDGAVVVTTEVGQVSAAMLATGAITLGYAEITSNSPASSGPGHLAIPGLSVPVTIPAGGRLIRVEAFADGVRGSTAGWSYGVGIWDGPVNSGTLIASSAATSGGANYSLPGHAVAVVAPSAGSKTYNVSLATGTGTAQLDASPSKPAFILVEAI